MAAEPAGSERERTVASGLPVDRRQLAFGCCPLGGHGWGSIDVESILHAVQEAHSQGITIFDTANVYGFGRSETRLASALGHHRRDVTIVTKVGFRWDEARGIVERDGSPAHIRAAVVESLRRLNLDCIPIVLLHWPDPSVPVHDSLGTLADLQREGVVGAFGASNLNDDSGTIAVEWSQLHVSLVTRPESSAAWGRCGTMAWGILEQGLLAGRVGCSRSLNHGDRRLRLPLWTPAAIAAIEPLRVLMREISLETGLTAAQLAIQWVLHCTPVTTAIVGLKSPAQLEEMLGVCEISVTAEALNRLSLAAGRVRLSLGDHDRVL